MKRGLAVLLAVGWVAWLPPGVEAQTPGEVFRKVAPSVVVIRAKGHEVAASGQTRFNETGSGVLISSDGKVMTAAHVVHAMDEISVEFLGGETVKAQVGDPVIIVGAPYGLSYSLSNGLISARWKPNTVYKTMPLAEFLQTTATINTGNSGGPMFSMNGEVIGIVSHNISKSGGSEGLGFVVTINTAKKLLLEKRSFWSWLEGQVLTDTDQQADLLNLPPGSTGFVVKTIAKGSPADAMGLRAATMIANLGGDQVPLGGDIILSVEGIKAEAVNLTKIRDLLASKLAGSPFKVTVLRAGRVLDLTGKVQ
jgi:serine protease Do